MLCERIELILCSMLVVVMYRKDGKFMKIYMLMLWPNDGGLTSCCELILVNILVVVIMDSIMSNEYENVD